MLPAKAACVALCGLLTLSGCSSDLSVVDDSPASSTAAPSVLVMTKEQAAERYLAIICRSNRVSDTANESVQRVITSGTITGTTMPPSIEKQLRRVARTWAATARQLQDENYLWPVGVRKAVRRVAENYYERSAMAYDLADSGSLADIPKPPPSDASVVRLRLGLPPSGRGCKAVK